MFRRQTDEVFSTLQQVQRRLSQHTDGSAPEDVVSPTIRRVTNPTDGRKVPPPSSTAPRSTTQGGRKGSQYGSKFQVNAGGVEQPAHVVPVIDRSNMAHTGKVLNEQGIAQEYAPMPAAQQAPTGILIRPPTALLLAVLFLGSVVGAYSIGRVSSIPPQQAMPIAGPADPVVANRTSEDIDRQRQINDARNNATQATLTTPVTTTNRNSAIQPTGDYVLVLQSYTQNTPEKMQRMRDLAVRYNKMARKYVNDGYKPWFGVRQPRSGGLQLVFGALDTSVFGIPNNDSLAKKMEKDMKRPFPTALWIKIR